MVTKTHTSKGGYTMKTLKKYFAMLASASFVMAVASATSHAAFTSKGTQVLSATAGVGGTPTVSITSVVLKTIAANTQLAAGAPMTWTGATPGAGFLVADDYIQMVSNINQVNGAIQIYTDNTNAAATPKYTGLVSSYTATPAGLIGATLTDQKLPTAWRASTYTLTGFDPSKGSPTNPTPYLWFYHEDKAQVAVWTSSATSFGVVPLGPSAGQGSIGGGDPYVTVYVAPGTTLLSHGFDNSGNETVSPVTTDSTHSGLHFAQSPTEFGGFVSKPVSTYIYTEADFTGALAGQTYSTNRLILEAYSL